MIRVLKPLLLVTCLLTLCNVALAQSVNLDSVVGVWSPELGPYGDGTLQTETPVEFLIRITCPASPIILGITNGFRVYSPDGAEWAPLTVDTTLDLTQGATFDALGYAPPAEGSWGFDLFWGEALGDPAAPDGIGADTVGMAGAIQEAEGLPPDFDEVVLRIGTGLDESDDSLTLCIDSCFLPPSVRWKWAAAPTGTTVYPTWEGPHCFLIVHYVSCCVLRGDVDDDGDAADIEDLVYLVEFMFQFGPEPPCIEGEEYWPACDVNADGVGPDIADVVYFVSYMFQEGPAPVPCP